jgi:hypothetical protein
VGRRACEPCAVGGRYRSADMRSGALVEGNRNGNRSGKYSHGPSDVWRFQTYTYLVQVNVVLRVVTHDAVSVAVRETDKRFFKKLKCIYVQRIYF